MARQEDRLLLWAFMGPVLVAWWLCKGLAIIVWFLVASAVKAWDKA